MGIAPLNSQSSSSSVLRIRPGYVIGSSSIRAPRRSCWRDIARVSRKVSAASASASSSSYLDQNPNQHQQQPLLLISSTNGDRRNSISDSPPSASDVVRNFYGGINNHDLSSVEGLIAENCVYEDLVFPNPFIGRKEIIAFFGKFIDAISTDLQFVIDDISDEDTSAVGVTWHLEWKGKPFPFSKGCSFYRLAQVEEDGARQIIYARDCVEPAIKPGSSTLVVIQAVAWLLHRFPQLAKWL